MGKEKKKPTASMEPRIKKREKKERGKRKRINHKRINPSTHIPDGGPRWGSARKKQCKNQGERKEKPHIASGKTTQKKQK